MTPDREERIESKIDDFTTWAKDHELKDEIRHAETMARFKAIELVQSNSTWWKRFGLDQVFVVIMAVVAAFLGAHIK